MPPVHFDCRPTPEGQAAASREALAKQTCFVRDVPVFEAGHYPRRGTFAEADLDRMVANHAHYVPAVRLANDEEEVGAVTALRRDGRRLLADLRLPAELAQRVACDTSSVAVEIFHDLTTLDGAKGKALRAVVLFSKPVRPEPAGQPVGVDAAGTVVYGTVESADDEEKAAPACTCPLADLVVRGCVCGAMKR